MDVAAGDPARLRPRRRCEALEGDEGAGDVVGLGEPVVAFSEPKPSIVGTARRAADVDLHAGPLLGVDPDMGVADEVGDESVGAHGDFEGSQPRRALILGRRWQGHGPHRTTLVYGLPWSPPEVLCNTRSPSVILMSAIDPDGPIPVYRQVADIIEARIRAGELKADRPVPSVAQLTQEFGIARGTALKALDTLRERRLVVTVVGRGTFVVRLPQEPEAPPEDE